MDLIDRYLHAVRGFLPADNQDDIVRELADDIRSQAADREEELGRPLTSEEHEALLKQFGHPMLLAAKYRPAQHLISPVVFPFYWFALKIALGCAFAVQFAMAIAMIVGGTPGSTVVGRLAAFPFSGAVTIFGWMTLAFAVVDLNVRRITSRAAAAWNPRTLVEPGPGARESRVSLGFEIVFSTVFLLWWLALPAYPSLVFGPAAGLVGMAPAWRALHMPLAVLWAASLVVLWTLLIRPDWTTLRLLSNVAGKAVSLVIALILLRADAIVTLVAGAEATAAHVGLVNGINLSFRIAVVVWVCAAIWEVARDLLRAWRPRTV